jgi:hypothetical protein
MSMRKRWIGMTAVLAVGATLISVQAAAAAQPGEGPVKVFILAGQSNMEGHARSATLDYLGEDPKYGKLLDKAKKPDGSLVVRDDVWIWYLGRKGSLEFGYGVSPAEKEFAGIKLGKAFGPELAFGIVMGDHYQEQVLLIKTAWGGHSLFKNFRPPSSGGELGPSYTKMVEHVNDVLENLKTLFPDYNEAQGYEIAGFLWFQGFNDQFAEEARAEYEQNLANLIKDLRKEFDAPKMPVVIGALGTGGQKGPIAEAQEAAANRPEFKGTARFVETALHWDHEADKMCREGVWKGPDKAKFYRIAAERPYHYLGSGKMMFLMGHDFGEAMVELLEK